MLLGYFLNDFETVPVALIVTGITSGFTTHMACISVVRSLSCTNLLKWHSVPTYTFPYIMMSSLLLGMVLLVGNVDSTIWLPYLHDLFLLILVHAHTAVHYVTVPLFHICWSLVQQTLYRVTLTITMLAAWSTLFSLFCTIWWQVVYIFMHKTPSTLFVQQCLLVHEHLCNFWQVC